MRSRSIGKRVLGWTGCAVLIGCGGDIATTTAGFSGDEVTGDVSDSLSDTGADAADDAASVDADATVDDTGSDEVGETGPDPDPTAGTDDGGVGGRSCMPAQTGLCEDLDAVVYCYTGPAGTCGVGSCTDGTQTCEPIDLDIGEWGPCVGDVGPGDETCDGVDDDCDGEVDEVAGTVSCGEGICLHEVATCAECDPLQGATDEVCDDGFDNDCDGVVDECGCGNAEIDPGEDCDGDDLAGQTCADLGHDGGTLACSASCTYDVSGCYDCGDGVLDGQEECDGADLAGASCQSLGYDGGSLACAANCAYDESACFGCNDGDIDAGEECDGNDLNGATCASLGYDGGSLDCTNSCAIDASACWDCGDGAVEGPEECDGANLDGATCVSLGYDSGTLTCANNCTYDESGCYGCNDGTIDPGEDCENNNLGGETCLTLGYDGGTLDCTNSCAFDATGCYLCAVDPFGYAIAAPPVEGGPGGCNGTIASLTCSSDFPGTVTDGNGNGSIDGPYTCGDPYAPLDQPENEDVYEFTCQADGDVQLQLTDMNCDLDIYVLAATCNPDSGCLEGSTNANTTNDSVTFTCNAGQTYYIVIEGYGWQNIFPPGGQCGAGEGDYVLHFATGDATGGCLEDCDDGIDNDQDGDIDCADTNCIMDPACMCP